MRKFLMAWMVMFALACFSVTWATAQDLKAEKQAIKLRQKVEWKSLKDRQKMWKTSLKGQPLPKAERIRIKHQMERERRELRERHRDEVQDMKDHQRVLKDSQANF